MWCLVAQSCLFATPWTLAHQAPLSMGILQARILEWVAMPSSRGLSQPRGWTQVSHIAGGLFTIWATRKAKNTGVGSLPLLQGVFLTQESKWGLLHCRKILYQLGYQESPASLAVKKFGFCKIFVKTHYYSIYIHTVLLYILFPYRLL